MAEYKKDNGECYIVYDSRVQAAYKNPGSIQVKDISAEISKGGYTMKDPIPVRFFEKDDRFKPGDLLWVQVGNYPFWPAMVSYDPKEGCFTKIRSGNKRSIRLYHVQYFGPRIQRGWTSENSVLKYEGEGVFYKEKEKRFKMLKDKKQRTKFYNDFTPTGKIKVMWHISVNEAEIAFSIKDNLTRYVKFVFKYAEKPGGILENASQSNGNLKRRRTHKKNSRKSCKKARIASNINEDLCEICERGQVDLICSGGCLQSFHKDCLGISYECNSFKCVNCELGLLSCFICKMVVCKEALSSVKKCNQCSYYYHDECLQKFECSNPKKGICSLHACLTCAKAKKQRTLSKVRCFRCPTSFHDSPKCIPVGSVKLTPSIIICPDHFLGKGKKSPQSTVNISFCVICGIGGALVCCESCPNAVHASCVNKEIPEGDFFCEPCSNRQYLYIGMIVWAKTGVYRWWPAKLVDPARVPENIKNVDHYDGEFLVQFFETDEYFWTHRGRVIHYADYHREKDGNKKERSIISRFNLSLEEAAIAYEAYIDRISHKKCDRKPAYTHVCSNRAVPPAKVASPGQYAPFVCNCDPKKPNPCGPNSLCLNRSMLVECHPELCPAKENCENMRFLRRQYPKVELMKTSNRGWGLQTIEYIPKGTFVIEYVGEVITTNEYRKRFEQMVKNKVEDYYFLYLDSHRMIDAGPKGNRARFINHSCNPNCEMEKWLVSGDLRVGIFAITDIQPGEELTFNYQSDTIPFQHRCLCGSSNCQGFIGRNSVKTNQKGIEKTNSKSSGKTNGKKHVKAYGKKFVKSNGENTVNNVRK